MPFYPYIVADGDVTHEHCVLVDGEILTTNGPCVADGGHFSFACDPENGILRRLVSLHHNLLPGDDIDGLFDVGDLDMAVQDGKKALPFGSDTYLESSTQRFAAAIGRIDPVGTLNRRCLCYLVAAFTTPLGQKDATIPGGVGKQFIDW